MPCMLSTGSSLLLQQYQSHVVAVLMQLLSFGHAVVLRADVPCAGAWRVPVLARAVRHHVHSTTLDHSAVRRLLYCRGVKRFLQGQHTSVGVLRCAGRHMPYSGVGHHITGTERCDAQTSTCLQTAVPWHCNCLWVGWCSVNVSARGQYSLQQCGTQQGTMQHATLADRLCSIHRGGRNSASCCRCGAASCPVFNIMGPLCL